MTDSELLARIEKLERDSRRLKRFGGVALVLVAALGLTAATRPVPDVIKAHKFEAVDGAGKVQVEISASMGLPSPGSPELLLRSPTREGTISMKYVSGWPVITLTSPQANGNVAVGLATGVPGLALIQKANRSYATIHLSQSGEPSESFKDPQGFEMDLGSTRTQTFATGETQQTSADSIVMFGNDKKRSVIWKAP